MGRKSTGGGLIGKSSPLEGGHHGGSSPSRLTSFKSSGLRRCFVAANTVETPRGMSDLVQSQSSLKALVSFPVHKINGEAGSLTA